MTKVMTLEVITPERVLLTEKTNFVVAPGTEGPLGILYNHAPLITGLLPGVLKYESQGRMFFIAVSSGFMEIHDNRIVILADTAERPDEIDLNRALAAKERAEKRLIEQYPGLDVQRAELALNRALARIKVAAHQQAAS